LNAHHESVSFALPMTKPEQQWQRLLDTNDPDAEEACFSGKDTLPLQGRSLVLLRTCVRETPEPMPAADHAVTLPSDAKLPPSPTDRATDRVVVGTVP